jgi:muramoyltetrapeptide carboxypeptidase LdcA involved in peptidoglycan recycling
MPSIYPPKLRRGDLVRVVAPALSRAVVTEHDNTSHIGRRFAEMGLRLSYGRDGWTAFVVGAVTSR